MSNIYKSIYKFYPKNISAFSKEYDLSSENILFEKTISRNLPGWQKLYRECLKLYGSSHIEDRSNNEPSHIITLLIPNKNENHIIAFYISKIINKYCFRSTNIGPDITIANYPNQFNEGEKRWNYIDPRLMSEISNLKNLISKYFSDYSVFHENLDEVVDDVSSRSCDLGYANLFHLFFSNYLY
jgi:hypothetical protein